MVPRYRACCNVIAPRAHPHPHLHLHPHPHLHLHPHLHPHPHPKPAAATRTRTPSRPPAPTPAPVIRTCHPHPDVTPLTFLTLLRTWISRIIRPSSCRANHHCATRDDDRLGECGDQSGQSRQVGMHWLLLPEPIILAKVPHHSTHELRQGAIRLCRRRASLDLDELFQELPDAILRACGSALSDNPRIQVWVVRVWPATHHL